MARMTGGRAVVESLLAHGVDTLFGVVSIHTLDLFDALYDARDRIRFIGARHESAAAFMAYGYAQTTGKPGVIVSSTGPGAGNTPGALGEAYAASVPIVHLTTDVAPAMRNSRRGEIHEPNHQIDMFKSVTAWQTWVDRPGGVSNAIFEAFDYLRTNRPRPVDVEFATTALGEVDDIEILPPRNEPPPGPDRGAIARAADILAAAARPVILAGGGVITADASGELARLAERLGAAVATTYGGKGAISDDHPLAVGCIRGGRVYGDNPLFDLLADSDGLLVVGSRLSYTITAAVGLKLPERMVHLDIDPDVFGKNYQPAVRVQGDAKAGLAALDAALARAGATQKGGCRERLSEVRRRVRESLLDAGPRQQRVIDALRQAIPRNAIVSVDATIPAYWAVRGFPVYGPRKYVSPHAWSTIGMGFAAGLGARAGNPDVPVVVIHGDGGFQLNMQELGTAAQYGLAVTLVIFNDSAWGVLKRNQRTQRGNRLIGTTLRNPDFVALARAYGLNGLRVDTVAGLQDALSTAVSGGEFTLIEVSMPRGLENLE